MKLLKVLIPVTMFTALIWVAIILFILWASTWFYGCNHAPPVVDPPTGLPEVCLEFKPKYGYGWIDFSPANKWIVVSHWQDVKPLQHGNQKAIEVWQYTEPNVAPTLIHDHVWTGPLDYLSYPGYGEQGPILCANVKGGDGGRDELCFVDFDGGIYWLNIVSFDPGNSVTHKRTSISTYSGREIIVMDLLACNMSAPRGTRYSDLIVGYRWFGKITKGLFCYTAPNLTLKWSHWITEDGTPYGRFNQRWSCHRPFVIPWPNGKDCLWRGLGMLDWNGGGQLNDPSYQNYPIEMLDINGEDDYAKYHFDSCCYFDTDTFPNIIATEDGPWIWQYPRLSTYVKPNGWKYWQYRWIGSHCNSVHTHRLRPLGNDFIFTDVVHGDNSKYRVYCMGLDMKVKWSKKTWEEANVIEWDGNHTSKEVLTDYGILNKNGKVVYSRGSITVLENNFKADLFGTGHEQFLEAFSGGKIRAIANTEAKVNLPVPHNPNANFY